MNVKSIVTSWVIAVLLLVLVTNLSQNRSTEAPTQKPILISPEEPSSAQQEATQHAFALPSASRLLLPQS